MKLLASWTQMIGDQRWEHHWIVRATCAHEALEYARESLSVVTDEAWDGFDAEGFELNPKFTVLREDALVRHDDVVVKGWRRRGYEVVQVGAMYG